MSLLSNFVANHLFEALEKAFLEHEKEMQDLLLNEAKAFAEKLCEWVNGKVHA